MKNQEKVISDLIDVLKEQIKELEEQNCTFYKSLCIERKVLERTLEIN